MLYKFLYALYNTQVNTKKHYEGDSMYPQLACRESGAWWEPDDKEDTENHHDGDAAKLGGILCRQFRWYRELFRPVGMKGFFYIDNQ